ncbi:MAG: ABC transporter permease, partial [Verrucomicrobia bacterium]|nr:ABC transporter permease [Verrucomicrobiota bacterium]
MVMALNRRIIRIFKENKLRYLGILLLIILGSYTFIVAAGLSQNLANLVTSFTEEHIQEDLSFSTDKTVSESDSAKLAKESDII